MKTNVKVENIQPPTEEVVTLQMTRQEAEVLILLVSAVSSKGMLVLNVLDALRNAGISHHGKFEPLSTIQVRTIGESKTKRLCA